MFQFDIIRRTSFECIYLNTGPCQTGPAFLDIKSNKTLFIHLLSALTSVMEAANSLAYMFQIK